MRQRVLSLICVIAILLSNIGNFSASEQSEKQRWYKINEVDYNFDFTETKFSYYMTHEALAIEDRNNIDFADGRLICKDGKSFVFGSSKTLGDPYGLENGFLTFDLVQESGQVIIGLRTQRVAARQSDYGIWLKFKDGKLTITEKETNLNAEVDIPADITQENKYRINDNRSVIEILVNDTLIASIEYNQAGLLKVLDKNGNVITSTEESKIYPTGYFSLIPVNLKGYIDNLVFRHVEIDETLPEGEYRPVDYSSWVATDDLDRVTPTYEDTGKVRFDKYVGIFYFICMTGAGIKVQDNTKIYLERGVDGLIKYLETQGGEAYWSEPYYGYYRNTDSWVYRKHAYMLTAAGVDFIFIDISNEATFDDAHTILFDTWLQIRKEGGTTPQIVFMTGDTEGRLESHMKKLLRTVYSDKNYDKYKELFFMWEGKPLILGNPANISDNMKSVFEKFTIRQCWAWQDKDGYWNWLMEYPQAKGRNYDGVYEQMAVTMGHHPSASKGRSFVSGKQPNNGKQDFEFSSDTARYGLSFKQQFEYAIKMDPRVIMITGWNEWIAGKPVGPELNYFANTPVKGYTYVDQFNPEFSRDGEPMKIRDGVGFGDNFYYQMVSYIREFKGMNEIEVAYGQKTISADGDFSQWDNVGPEYRDTIGDTKFRNEPSYDLSFRYINNTGRNDFDYAKVSQDKSNIYFMVKCINNIVTDDGTNWMNLYLDTDMKNSTGWEGYDYVINRSRENGKCSIEKFKNNSWEFEKVADAEFTIDGQYMVIKIAKKSIGLSKDKVSLDFKWADNSTTTGNVMQFMDLGDTAPNDRFNFRYKGTASGVSLTIIIIAVIAVVIVAEVVVFILIKARKKKAQA